MATLREFVVIARLMSDPLMLYGKSPIAVIVDEFYVGNANLASETKVPAKVTKRTGGKRRRNPERWT